MLNLAELQKSFNSSMRLYKISLNKLTEFENIVKEGNKEMSQEQYNINFDIFDKVHDAVKDRLNELSEQINNIKDKHKYFNDLFNVNVNFTPDNETQTVINNINTIKTNLNAGMNIMKKHKALAILLARVAHDLKKIVNKSQNMNWKMSLQGQILNQHNDTLEHLAKNDPELEDFINTLKTNATHVYQNDISKLSSNTGGKSKRKYSNKHRKQYSKINTLRNYY